MFSVFTFIRGKAYFSRVTIFAVLFLQFFVASISPSQAATNTDHRKVVRILTIDGGGIRGILPLTILRTIEEKLTPRGAVDPVALDSYFDIVAGTSTGGIIVLGLETGKHAYELLRLYMEQGDKIFAGKKSLLGRIFSSAYDALL